jgi:protein-S-isoprenylcysteine O-methyltransferase Ste14
MRGSSTSADRDRGGRWVAAQGVLMALAVAAALAPVRWPAPAWFAAIGVGIGLIGLVVVIWGVRALGAAATPFPLPRAEGRLVVSGPYALVRHPIYTGGALFFLGLALATSPVALVPVVALVVLWRGKATFEETLLAERYPAYEQYRRRVVGAFVPRSLRADRAI